MTEECGAPTRSSYKSEPGCIEVTATFAITLPEMHIISKPTTPHAYPIRETLHTGSQIHVRGNVTWLHHKNFTVELLCGEHVVLHIDFRFHAEHEVVLNSKVYGVWGSEMRRHNPLNNHDSFDLSIHVHEHYYHLSLNGQHLVDFPHRKPVETVQAIGLKGCVDIDTITFSGFRFVVDWNAPHDYGHGGYHFYGTPSYREPVLEGSSPQKAHF